MVLLEIVKIPSRHGTNQARSKRFGTENLYLELLENKSKLRKGLRQKAFDYESYAATKSRETPDDAEEEEEEIEEEERKDSEDDEIEEDLTESEDPPPASDPAPAPAPAAAAAAIDVPPEPLPSLEDLKKSGKLETDRTPIDAKEFEREDRRKKRSIMDKIERLKPRLRNYEIPPVSMHSDLDELQEAARLLQRRFEVQRQKESYKLYLTMFYMVIELAGSRYFSMDTKGYCSSQMAKIAEYDDLLEELGEETVDKNPEVASPTSRLLWAVGGNTLLFFANRMMSASLPAMGAMGGMGAMGAMGGEGLRKPPTVRPPPASKEEEWK